VPSLSQDVNVGAVDVDGEYVEYVGEIVGFFVGEFY